MTKDKALKLALEALEVAQDNLRPHGDNCFLHDDVEYNRCFCGKDSLVSYLQDAVEKLDTAIKQARSAPTVQEPGRNHYEDGDVFERIAAMKKSAAQPAPVPTNCRHCGGPDNVLCGGQCKAAQPAPVTTREIDT